MKLWISCVDDEEDDDEEQESESDGDSDANGSPGAGTGRLSGVSLRTGMSCAMKLACFH
jgi:hypothetical protein